MAEILSRRRVETDVAVATANGQDVVNLPAALVKGIFTVAGFAVNGLRTRFKRVYP
jgi:hypothetical protein